MADSDKNILITTAKNTANDPSISFTGGDNTPVTMNVIDDGSLSFQGIPGQLFAITNDMTGTIFSVNDATGIPSLEILDNGTFKISPYTTTANPVLVGQGTATAGVTALMHVNGAIRVGGSAGYTLPATDGNSGEVLVTNGSGVLSFAAQSGGGGGGSADEETIIAYSIALGQL